MHVRLDILHSQPESISVSSDGVQEYDFHQAASLKDNLFISGRGYFKLSYLKEIEEDGGSYVVRAKTTSNPLIRTGYNAQGQRLERFKQLYLGKIGANLLGH